MKDLKKIINLYIRFFSFAPARNTGIVLSNLFFGLSQGFGIVALIPLLQMLEKNSLGNNKVMAFLSRITNSLGISISIELIIVLFLCLVIITAILNYARTIWQSEVQQDFTAEIRKDLFSKLIRSDWIYLSGQNRNEYSHVLTSEIPAITALNFQLFSLVSALVIFIIYVVLALVVSCYFTLFVLACGLILFILLKGFIARTYIAGKNNFFTNRNIYKQFDDFWEVIKFAKVHGSEKYHYDRFNESNEQFAKERNKIMRLSLKPQTINSVASALILSLVIYIGYKYAKMSLSSFLILILLFSRLFPQLMRMHSTYMQIVSLIPSYENTMAMRRDLESRLKPSSVFSETTLSKIKLGKAILFQEVTFGYTSDRILFDRINIKIPARKITGIIGPSGIGKTTLMDLVTGLLSPKQGTILIDDSDLTNLDISIWHNSIAYVPQDSVFINSSLRENLTMGNDTISDEIIWNTLERVNAESFTKELKEGLDTLIRNNAQQFSGGERQRLAIARALLREPSLLLLDEITSSLDSKNEQKIIDILMDLKKEITIIMITHKNELVQYFDEIIDVKNLMI